MPDVSKDALTVHEERKVISTRRSKPLLLSWRPKEKGE